MYTATAAAAAAAMIADALQLSRRSLVALHTEFPSDPSPSMRKMPTDKPADTDDSLDDGVWTPARAMPSIALHNGRIYLGLSITQVSEIKPNHE